MATVKARGDLIALISGNQIKVHDVRKGTNYILNLPESPNDAKDSQNNSAVNSTENSPTKKAGDNKNSKQGEENKKNDQSQKKGSWANVDLGPNKTLSAAFSDSGKLIAVSDDRKQLHLYQKSNSDEATSWTLLTSRSIIRRSSCVLFTHDEKNVILGDKSGDVYRFSVIKPTEPGQLMMGHLSVLLDMALVDNDRYLVTCDRDEKVRVSLFPNTYNIHCYCLGHTDFLTRLVYVPEVKVIISGGGDGTLKFWNLEGKNLHSLKHGVIQLQENKEEKESNANSSTSNIINNNVTNIAAVKCMAFDPCSKTLAVSFDQSMILQLYKIEVSDLQCFEVKLCDQRQLPAEPWDIHFLTNSHLLVLSPVQDSTVSLFDCSTPDKNSFVGPKISEVSQEYLQKHSKLEEFLKTVNSDWAFFEPSVKVDSLISSLPKSKIDNMSDYLERKEQQVKKKFQPKGKRKNQDLKNEDKCQLLKEQEPPTKSVKVDD